MRLFSLLVLTFACAHQPAHHARRAPVEEAEPAPVVVEVVEPPARSIRLVAHRPPHYKFVGNVKGSAKGDFVLAAKQARKKLTDRAEALGADVVQIQRVDPGSHGRVLIAGRAYRVAD